MIPPNDFPIKPPANENAQKIHFTVDTFLIIVKRFSIQSNIYMIFVDELNFKIMTNQWKSRPKLKKLL